MKPRAFLPLGLVALSVLAYAAQGVVIKRAPKVGDKANYKLTGNFEVAGAEVVLSGTTDEEVTKVEGDSFSMKATTKMSINVMGQDMPQEPSTVTSTTKLDGTIVEVKNGETPGDGSSLRIAHLNTLYLSPTAVANDATWTLEGKKDEKLDTPGYKLEFKLVGEEKVGKYDTYKITSTGGETEGETPTKVKATYWIEKSTGNTVRALTELTDAVFRPEVPPLSGKMDVVRQD